jgi:hypothetical protein
MGKWSFLKEYAKQQLKYNPDLTITDLAKRAQQEFQSQLTQRNVEQVRKIISREVCKQDSPFVPDSRFDELEDLATSLSSMIYKPEPIQAVRQNKFDKPGMYIVLGCVHVPGHNVRMINSITKLIEDKKNEIQGLMLIGDFLDMNTLSGHNRGQFTAVPGLTLTQEYEAGNKVLDQLTAPLSHRVVDKVYIYGNHEDRWNRHMSDMQNAKTPLPSPAEALRLKERGFHTFTNWTSDYVKLGKHLELIHGQYYNTHCAKQHIDKLRGSVLFAHTHRIQMYVEGKTAGFNIGWCGDVDTPFFNYAERGTKSQWQNGFAVVHVDEDGDYFVNQIFFHNNKFYFNGKCYS